MYKMMNKLYLAVVLSLFLVNLSSAGVKSDSSCKDVTTDDPSHIKFHFLADNSVDTLVVSCIDFRLRTELENYMVTRLGPNSYDEVALAGASLGILNDEFPGWNKTFRQNLDIAVRLHGVNKVIFIDHRDCGAYKMIKGKTCCTTEEKEEHVHAVQMNKVRAYMKEKYPNLQVETLLMNLDGTVDTIEPKH
jgi:carbonic anhydrase